MKKICSLIVLLLVVFIYGLNPVKADAVTMSRDFIDGVWSYHYRNGEMWTFGNLPFNYADGKLVYCIEPDARVNVGTYYTDDNFSISGYDDYEKTQMELISYYGYGFPGHDSIKYYMATQELIWLYSPDEWIKWTNTDNEYGEEIDINYEKYEIMRLVNSHYTKPSFYGQNFTSNSNTLYLRDNNNTLDKYEIMVPDELSYERESYSINFTASKLGTYTVKFKKRREVEERTQVYYNDSLRTQKLAVFGEPDIEEFAIDVSFTGSYVEIYKKDIDTNQLITDKGNVINIRNKDTNEFIRDTNFVSSNGKVWFYFTVGRYKIEELSSSEGYYLNTNGLEFEIVEGDDTSKKIDFYNDKVEGKININKTDEDGNNIKGVIFEIYDEEGNIVDTITTTDSKTESKLLPLGKYIVKEKETVYGYQKNDTEYEVNLEYNNQEEAIVYKDIDIVNEKIKCKIVLVTTSDKKVLNTTFNVYDLDYNLVYTGKTIDGKAEFVLPYGDYILKEIEVPDGYKINDEEIRFSVNDITCASNFTIDNKKVEMPDTYKEGNIFLVIMIIINVGSYVYYKKTN